MLFTRVLLPVSRPGGRLLCLAAFLGRPRGRPRLGSGPWLSLNSWLDLPTSPIVPRVSLKGISLPCFQLDNPYFGRIKKELKFFSEKEGGHKHM